MPATSTLADALIALAEEDGFGTYIAAGTGATTTITETDTGVSELRGPFTGLKIGVGRPVTVITGGTIGEDTYVSNWVPSTGVVTLSPAITTAATGFIIWESDIEHGKYVEKAVSRALTNRIGRWELRPLTFVPDGDLQGATVTDYWTAAANGTAAYASAQVYPAPAAVDAVGQVGLNRVVQLTSTGATSMDGNGIRLVLTAQLRSWYFITAIRLVSGTGTMTFTWRDNTNSADISAQVSRGNDANTLTTTNLGDFMVIEGTFQVPATCAEIAPRVSLSATTMVGQMAPIIAFPQGTYSFPLPNRIESDDSVGNFLYGTPRFGPGGLSTIAMSQPITSGGYEHWFYDYGDHRTVGFNFPIHKALWFEEYVNGAEPTALTSTTTFPADRVHKWAKAELLNWLFQREQRKHLKAENGTPLPNSYRQERNAAFKAADWNGYEPGLKNIVGRR